jgi:hypothetical protein
MRLDLRFILPGAAPATVLLDEAGRLPRAEIERDEDDAAIVPVDAFLRERWGFDEPVLEVHPRWAGVPEGEPIPALVTTEPAPASWRPPKGLLFGRIPADPDDLAASIQPRAAELLGELRTGAPPPELRPRWARAGWRRRASDWMRLAAAETGRPLTGEPRPFFLRGISALLRAPTAEGDVFLKAVFPIFHAEPVITKLLAERLPRDVPRVLAIEPEEGWLLVEDIGSRWIGSLPEADRPAALAAGARTLIEIQRMMADRPGDLTGLLAAGAQDRGLASIPGAFADALAAVGPVRAVRQLADEARADAVARVEAAVGRLAGLPFPVSLVHGDFHSDNAAIVDDRVVVIDWSDAAIGSPLVDLVTWVAWSGDRGAEVDAATDAWVDGWSPIVPASTIRDRLDDILVTGAAYQVISYDAIVRALEPATRYTMTGGGDHFLPMILERLGSSAGRS